MKKLENFKGLFFEIWIFNNASLLICNSTIQVITKLITLKKFETISFAELHGKKKQEKTDS
jgi:hypothetical protein